MTVKWSKVKKSWYSSFVWITSLLRESTCHIGSLSVTCHLAAVTFPPFHQPKLVLNCDCDCHCVRKLESHQFVVIGRVSECSWVMTVGIVRLTNLIISFSGSGTFSSHSATMSAYCSCGLCLVEVDCPWILLTSLSAFRYSRSTA